ncbi:phage portal protein [Priestia flexa]|uniref:phage portal protein n=1 Tax=Priestia flexa TaxID=86664 RepID=UPI003B97F647
MRVIGLFEYITNRDKNSNVEQVFEEEINMFINDTNRIHMKRLAVDTCVSFLARTIAQSRFNVRNGKDYIKDELYYKLSVRPNKNQTATTFWETFVNNLIYENECLIIVSDDDHLIIADSFVHNKYALYEDTYTNVLVGDHEYQRTFKQSEVIHIKYRNDKLMPLINSLFNDYGSLFGSILFAQKKKNQIRATVDVNTKTAQTKDGQSKLQNFINRVYGAISLKDVAIIPQQEGYTYNEQSSGNSGGQSVDEINKVTNGYFNQIAMAIGIPISLVYGDMADVEKQTKNFIRFTVNPLLKKLENEINAKFFTKDEFLKGERVEVKAVSYYDIVDIAASIDKLISSGFATGNEVRKEVGWDESDDPNLDKHYITKNYSQTDVNQVNEGGESDNDSKD